MVSPWFAPDGRRPTHPCSDGCDLVGVIDEGSTSVVYRMRDRETGAMSVAKHFRPKYSIKMAQHEYALLQRLGAHPNVINVFSLHSTPAGSWMYMEDGGHALVERLLNSTVEVPEDVRTSWCMELLSVVYHLHVKGIAHMDLKLDNITVADDGRIRLIDFGYAHVYQPEEVETSLVQWRGSPSYAAPEVLAEKVFSAYAADVWSLGICIFAINTKVFPFGKAFHDDDRFQKFAEVQRTTNAGVEYMVRSYRLHGYFNDRFIDKWVHALERMLTVVPTARIRMCETSVNAVF